jgi:murein DD-endopeptidase MepM/ murein hydrolase activator NlpD
MKQKKQKRSYTVMLVPDGKGRTVSLRVNEALIRTVVVCITLLSLGVFVLVYFSGSIAVRLQRVAQLEQSNKNLGEQNRKLRIIAQKIENIEELNRYLRQLALTSGVAPAPPPPAAADQPDASIDSAVQTPATAVARREYSFSELARMQDRTLANGSRSQALSIPYIRPVNGWITRGFNPEDPVADKRHSGVDFAAASGATIVATAEGIVTDVFFDPDFGKMVVIDHKMGYVTRYGHCSAILVSRGTHVTRGQTIALVGNTGRSSAPHLHYEVLKDGREVDPIKYMIDYKS